MGGRGGAPGARPLRRMGSVGAAEPRGQPGHQRRQEEEEEEPSSLERVEKRRGEKKKKETKTKKKQTKKNPNEKPNGRSKYDMKTCGQMRSREAPRQSGEGGGRGRRGRDGQAVRGRSRGLGEGLRPSPAWAGAWSGTPAAGGAGPRGSGRAPAYLPSWRGAGLCCSIRLVLGEDKPGVLSWKPKPRAECWQEVASMTRVPQTRRLCQTQRLALSPL